MCAADASEKKRLREILNRTPAKGDAEALCRHVLSTPWFLEAGSVMAFVPMPMEPDIREILRRTLDMGKRLALPRCMGGGIMKAHWVRSLEDLIPGPFQIPEPDRNLPEALPAEIDLILTPGLAFDRRGGRLGRGMGYYDRFLADFTGRTLGICFQEALLPRVPMDRYDLFMDAVATDLEVLTFIRTEGDAN